MSSHQFRVRIYSDHAIVGKDTLIKPLAKLGARLLEMAGEPVSEKATVAPAKKTRKKRTKKEKPEPPVEEAGNELGL